MSGLKRKEIWRRIKKTKTVIFFDEDEIKELFKENFTKDKG